MVTKSEYEILEAIGKNLSAEELQRLREQTKVDFFDLYMKFRLFER